MGKNVTRVDDHSVVTSILSGRTQRQAAAELGCSERTITARLARPEVRALIDNERERRLNETADLLAAASRGAVTRLVVATQQTANDTLAVRAAIALLTLGLQYRDAGWVEARLGEVEAQLAAQADDNGWGA